MMVLSNLCIIRRHIITSMIVPRKPAAKYIDTASGDRFDLGDSGLVPKYTKKKVYTCTLTM